MCDSFDIKWRHCPLKEPVEELFTRISFGEVIYLIFETYRETAAAFYAQLQKDIEKLESVQKLACKICTKNWSGSYSDLRHILGLPTIRDRRTFLKLCTMYKITNNIFCFPENLIKLRSGFHTHPMSTRSVSGNLLYQPFAHTNSFLYSCVPNTSYLWNGLPNDITSSSSFYCFKYRLRSFFAM